MPNTAVIIPAAGSGTRMGTNLPKQFMLLAGIPILVRTVQQFHEIDEVKKIYIGTSPVHKDRILSLIHQYHLKKCELVPGGDTRQQTVANCLKQVSHEIEVVAVHDAVRPLVTRTHLIEVINQAAQTGAALSAMPAKDTIKQKLQNGKLKTINRDSIYYAATPQAASLEILREAYSQGIETTDESSLIEHLGHKIAIIPCDGYNIKLTTPEDLAYAEFILANGKHNVPTAAAEKEATPSEASPSKSTSSAGFTSQPTDHHVTIYTDGACSGNPGPGGYGVILRQGDKQKELSAGYKHTTNNRMELMAVIVALESLKKPCAVNLYSDSKYMIDSITKGWVYNWQKKNWIKSDKKPALNVDLWERLLLLLAHHQVNFTWVKGHATNPYNNRCDELAVAASKSSDLIVDTGFTS